MSSTAFSFIELFSYSIIDTKLEKKLFLHNILKYLLSSNAFNINNFISSSGSVNNKFIK